MSALPAGIFATQTALTQLFLYSTGLTGTGLPWDIFSSLLNLTDLRLYSTNLGFLPADVLSSCTSLTYLDLHATALTPSGLPAGTFSKQAALATLNLGQNTALTYLPSGMLTSALNPALSSIVFDGNTGMSAPCQTTFSSVAAIPSACTTAPSVSPSLSATATASPTVGLATPTATATALYDVATPCTSAGTANCYSCASGLYISAPLTCSVCPPSSGTALAAATGVGITVGVVFGFGLVLGVPAVLLARKRETPVAAAALRTVKFMVTTFIALQLLAQVARTTPVDAPPFVAAVFSYLRVLQFSGAAAVPAACTTVSPFLLPSLAMGGGLALEALWAIVTAVWLLHVRSRARTRALAAAGGATDVDDGRCCALVATQPALLLSARGAVTLAGLLYAIVTNAALDSIYCTSTSMTLANYRLLLQDGTTASAALGVSVATVETATYASAPALFSQAFPVRLLASNPIIVCGESAQAGPAALSAFTLALFVAGLPLVVFLLLRCLAIPAVLEDSVVPLALLPDAPHVMTGGGLSEAVVQYVVGSAPPPAPVAASAGTGGGSGSGGSSKGSSLRRRMSARSLAAVGADANEPEEDINEADLRATFDHAAAERRARYIAEGRGCGASGDDSSKCSCCCATAACAPGRALLATLCGAGSRYDPEEDRAAAAAAAAAAPAHPRQSLSASARGLPSFKGNVSGSSSSSSSTNSIGVKYSAEGKVAEATRLLTGDVSTTLCGCTCACTRRYRRKVQTGADVVDSSLPLRNAPVLALFTSSDVRASRADVFVPLGWAILAATGIAQTLAPDAGSSSMMLLARGAGLAALFLIVLTAYLAVRPMRPHSEWLLPLRAYILVLSALGSVYTAAAAIRENNSASDLDGLPVAINALGIIVAALAVGMLPVFVFFFALDMFEGTKEQAIVQQAAVAGEQERAFRRERERLLRVADEEDAVAVRVPEEAPQQREVARFVPQKAGGGRKFIKARQASSGEDSAGGGAPADVAFAATNPLQRSRAAGGGAPRISDRSGSVDSSSAQLSPVTSTRLSYTSYASTNSRNDNF